MARAIHWQVPFVSLGGTAYTINIYEEDYEGEPITLVGSSNPFVTDESTDEDPFTPVRTQSGYIRIVAQSDGILDEIMPTKATDRPVTLTNSEGTILWQGFIKGEQYSQPWDGCPYEVELPVVSVLGVAEGIDFEKTEGIHNVTEVVDYLITNSNAQSVTVIMPTDYQYNSLYAVNELFQTRIYEGERRDLETEDIYNPESVYDVLTAWCTFFGFTLHEYGTKFIFTKIGCNSYSNNEEVTDHAVSSLNIAGAHNTRSIYPGHKRLEATFETGETPDVISFGEFRSEFIYLANYLFDSDHIDVYNYNGNTRTTELLRQVMSGNYQGGQIRGGNYNDCFLLKTNANIPSNLPALVMHADWPVYIQSQETQGGAYNVQTLCIDFKPKYRTTAYSTSDWQTGTEDVPDQYMLRLKCDGKYYNGSSWVNSETAFLVSYDGSSFSPNINEIPLPWATPITRHIEFGFMIHTGRTQGIFQQIENFSISVNNDERLSAFVRYKDKNVIIRNLGTKYNEVYTVDSRLAKGKGCQMGIGRVRNSDGTFYTGNTNYNLITANLIAGVVAEPHEILSIEQAERFTPQDTFSNGDKGYIMLSQSTNWCNDITTIKIIES